MADQGTDSIKTPLLEKAELPSAPPPDAQHASSEPSPPQYSESAYPPPSSAAPRQPPYPPSAQPVSCPYPSQPYPPDAAQGPPAGGTGYPASAPPVSMPAGQVATNVGGGVTYNVPPQSAYGAYGYGAGANEVARKTSLAIFGVVFVVFCIIFCVIIIISIAVPLSIASRFNHAT